LIGRALVFFIDLYRKYISPSLGSNCRFIPTCSQYAAEAIAEWGAFCGLGLAAWRLLRCNPFGKRGYDPVPLRRRNSGQ